VLQVVSETIFMQDQSTIKLSVLVIEDDVHIGLVLKIMLEHHGFYVILITDGDAARHLINTKTQPPSLVLLDIQMPYADGYETIRRIRSREGWHSVPIVMLSARNNKKDVERAFELGANDYVTKPFYPSELIARVRRLVKEEAEVA
jgi:DNA-binding response OmpR family regulator